jgi:FkbM family methyltransferase
VDVGANIGHLSLLASGRVGPGGRVLAVEANPQTASILRKNVERNGASNVTVVEVACCATRGTAKFFMSSDCGKSSLSSDNAESKHCVDVPCDALDNVVTTGKVDSIDVVKIDVEGAELQVLTGMEHVLKKFHPVVVIEVKSTLLASFGGAPSEVEDFFRVRGYQRSAINMSDSLFRFTAPG